MRVGRLPAVLRQRRNTPFERIRGPGRQTWNTRSSKNFRFKERYNIQFRAEAYNTSNHTNWNAVDTTIQYNAGWVNTRTSSGISHRRGIRDYAIRVAGDVLTFKIRLLA